MTNLTQLKVKIHRLIEEYDSSKDDNQRRIALHKLLKILDENHLVLQKIMPNFHQLYCELRYCYSQKSSINKFMMSKSKYISMDIHQFISEGIKEQPISEVMSLALDQSFVETMSRFLPNVTSKLIDHFLDEFDKATK